MKKETRFIGPAKSYVSPAPPAHSLRLAAGPHPIPQRSFSIVLAGTLTLKLFNHLIFLFQCSERLHCSTLNPSTKSNVTAASSIGGATEPRAIEPIRGTLGQPVQLLAG